MSQCKWPDCIILIFKNLTKQISKLSFNGKCILASGLQKHAIYALAVKVYKATQKHRADAFHLHEDNMFLITSMPAECLYRKVT